MRAKHLKMWLAVARNEAKEEAAEGGRRRRETTGGGEVEPMESTEPTEASN